MFGHPQLNVFSFMLIAFLPATVALACAWVVWTTNHFPELARWRLVTFNWALICALLDTLLFLGPSARFLATNAPVTGIWLITNWLCVVLLLLILAASFIGKGWSRGLLLCWGVLQSLGVFVVYARVP